MICKVLMLTRDCMFCGRANPGRNIFAMMGYVSRFETEHFGFYSQPVNIILHMYTVVLHIAS